MLALAVLALAAPAAAPPPPPLRMDGRALTLTDLPLGIGTPVRAVIDGVVYSNLSEVHDGQGSYSLQVLGNHMLGNTVPETPEVKEGADLGEEVLFAAGDFTASTEVFQEVVVWFPGAARTLDLHVGSAATIPAPLKIQSLLPRPARGGNQTASVCNPTSSPVDLGTYYLERNEPGSYRGPRLNLSGNLDPGQEVPVELPSPSFLDPLGDALKLVFENPGGAQTAAGGRDLVVDRVEYNATSGGTLTWEPGNTILDDAPAPRPGYVLERSPFCADTNFPDDFREAPEPGLPPNGPPTVSVTDPAQGVVLRAGQPFTVRWRMVDDIFLASYLTVWVNATYAGSTTSLLAGAEGAVTVDWVVPDVEATGAVITVEVEDPFGEHATATSGTFSITRGVQVTDLAILVAILVVAVILVFLLIALISSRRKRGVRPPGGAPPPSGPPAGPASPGGGEAVTGERRKTCPRCGTSVFERDWTCFYCGYRFPGPP